MNRANSRAGFLRRLTVLTIVVSAAVIISACAAPTAAPSAQTAATQAPAASQAPAPTDAPMATEAPTNAPAATDAPVATEAPTEAPTEAANQVPAASSGGAVSFSKDVVPIIEQTCIKCHGGSDGIKGDLSMKTHADLMKGGQDGVVVVPGDAANSMMVKLITEGKMPKRGPKLPQEQIDLIAQWVNEGAPNN